MPDDAVVAVSAAGPGEIVFATAGGTSTTVQLICPAGGVTAQDVADAIQQAIAGLPPAYDDTTLQNEVQAIGLSAANWMVG